MQDPAAAQRCAAVCFSGTDLHHNLPGDAGTHDPPAAGLSGHPVAARAAPGQSQAESQGTDLAKITKTFQYGKHTVTLETGEVARQASGAVIVKMDDTVLLVSAVAAKSAREARTSSRSPSTTRRSSTPVAASPVASSSAKAVRPRRKR